jgi:hypothetical protein
MKLATFHYTNGKWSTPGFPALDSEQTLILVFAAPCFHDHPEPIQELSRQYPNSLMIGCSSAGEIFGAEVYDNSLSVAVMRLEKTLIRIVKAPNHNPDQSHETGVAIAKALDSDDLQHIIVLSEGLNINGTALTQGLNSTRKKTIITGGLAGDGSQFKQTWTIYNGEILKNHVVAVGFYGNAIRIGYGSRGGWDVFGPDRYITRSKNTILYELDHQPALAIYKAYLGNMADGLPATGLLYPLAIRKKPEDTKYLVRTILAIDEAAQSLIFAGNIPNGHVAQLMHANFERIITGAGKAGELAKSILFHDDKTTAPGPLLSIAISCVGRKLLLGSRVQEECEATHEVLPPNTHQIGFYSYGELSPHSSGHCDLHNQTMTLTLIYEK